MPTLVFVHGRSQQGRDPDQLRAKWAAGLNSGLTVAGRPTIDASAAVLPFFGDLLHAEEIKAVRDKSDIDLESVESPARAPIDPTMPAEVSEAESAVLRSMADSIDLTAVEQEGRWEAILRLPFARRIAKAIADRTHADQEIIEGFLRDVAVYLKVARTPILDLVRSKLPDGELCVIAHSLGSAVAADLLDDPGVRDRTTALVTIGSPLGLEGVYRNLATPGPRHPGVGSWLTAWDPQDFVALGHPIKDLYGDPLDEQVVHNPAGKAHSIEHYLGNRDVATWIADRLDG